MLSPVSSSSESSNLGVPGMPLTQLHYVKFYYLGWCLTRGYSQKVMSQNTFPGISFLGISLENSYIPIYPFEERFKRNTWNHDVRKCETSNNLILLRKQREREREQILVIAPMFYHIKVLWNMKNQLIFSHYLGLSSFFWQIGIKEVTGIILQQSELSDRIWKHTTDYSVLLFLFLIFLEH